MEVPVWIKSQSEEIEEDVQPLKWNRPELLASSSHPATLSFMHPSSLFAAPSMGQPPINGGSR